MELRERKTGQTLKERLSEHYHNRDFTVNEKDANKMGKAFFWGMTITLFIESQFILIPGLYWTETWKMIVCILLVWFTLFESVVNWMGVYFAQTSFVTPDIKEKLYGETAEIPPGWRNCAVCQVDAPPRSHHCRHCNRCVLKRDHHCFFTNSCVGFYNQRFFVMFCIYMIWGNLYALYLQLNYLNQYCIPIVSWDAHTYIPFVTLVYFFIGKLSFLHLFLIIHAWFCIMCLAGALFFTSWQLLLASSGVTSHEAWKNISCYKGSTSDNLRSVFGSLKKVPLQLLLPFRVDQRGNGVVWEVKNIKGH